MKRLIKILTVSISISLLHFVPGNASVVIPPIPITSSSPDSAGTKGPGIRDQAQTGQTDTVDTLKPPEVQAQGALLMDAATGKVLYEKNGDTRFYPASITKLMTALLTAENTNLDDVVTFSAAATTNLESGSVTLNLTEGDKLTVRDSLYALMLKSANEVANGLAEHVAGSIYKFADMMNARALALGCTNTHFVNPNGLNNSEHYTTPKDMALIAREAFNNQVVRKVSSTLSYEIPATKKAKARTVTMGHKMLYPTDSRYYEGIAGGKTGYTSLAGNTLVTCVERDGVRLIAVVMKSKSTHYTDTIAMLDYGFQNLSALGLTASNADSGWIPDGSRWQYMKKDGKKATNEWLTINGSDYWFDADTYMATGWRQFQNGAWYYFKSSGAMAVNSWAQNGSGAWFYLGGDGVMMTNAITPDGYRVNEYGVWQ